MIGKQIGLYIIFLFLELKFTRYSIHKRRRFIFAFCSWWARVAANYNHY